MQNIHVLVLVLLLCTGGRFGLLNRSRTRSRGALYGNKKEVNWEQQAGTENEIYCIAAKTYFVFWFVWCRSASWCYSPPQF